MRYFTTIVLVQVLTFNLWISVLHGQNALVPDILPSADATALGKYGDFPVSHYTGQANISIPIETMEANGIKLSFSLNYDAGGVLINHHTGWVGQNWSLNGGGVITRSVNGIADEVGLFPSPNYYNVVIPYIFVVQDDDFLTVANTDTYSELKSFSEARTINGYADTEPDVFNFNCMGKSGKFVLDQNGEWKVTSDYNFKVVFDYLDANNFQDPFIVQSPGNINKNFEKVIKGFTLIDDQGYKYTFGYDENAIEYSIPFFRQYAIPSMNFPNWIATAWHMTKVEDYRENILFDFNYERSYFTAQVFETKSYRTESCKLQNGTWINASASNTFGGEGSLISQVYITDVNSIKGQKIEFKKSNAIQKKFVWTTYLQSTYAQSAIAVCNYIPECPMPLPFLQESSYYSFDHEAAYNINPFEGLMWKKLDTIKVYNNTNQLLRGHVLTYNNNISERLNLLDIKTISKDFETNPTPQNYGYQFFYDNFSGLPDYMSKQTDHWGYYDGSDYYSSPTNSIGDELSNHYGSRESNLSYCKTGTLTQINYPTGGKSIFEFELHQYGQELNDNHQLLSNSNGSSGGLRIKSIKHYDAINAVAETTSQHFFYVKNYNTGGSTSSGILGLKPKYAWVDWLSATNWWPSGGYKESVFSINTLVPMSNLFEPPITYSEVAVVDLNGSYNIYKYTNHENIKDELPYATCNLGNSPYQKYTDRGHLRGKLKEMLSFATSNQLVMSEINHYRNDIYSQNSSTHFNISTDVIFGVGCPSSNTDKYYKGDARKIYHDKYYIDSIVTTYYYVPNEYTITRKNQYVTPSNNEFGNDVVLVSSTSVKNSNGKVYATLYEYPFNHSSIYLNQNGIYDFMKTKNRIGTSVVEQQKVDGLTVDGKYNIFQMFNGQPELSKIKKYELTWLAGTPVGTWQDNLDITNYDLIFLEPTSYQNLGWSSETITLNSRGNPTAWTYLDRTKGYQYYPNDYLQTITDIDGLQQNNQYDGFGRLKQNTLLPKNVQTHYTHFFPTTPTEKAYFKSRTTYPPSSGNSAIDSIVHISYVDGLGRPIQANHKYGAPDGADVITKTEYDNVGRPYRTYEPIAANGNHGAYYTGAFGGGYTQQLYESNPLDRVSQTTPPAWHTSQHTYGTNTSTLTDPEGQVYPANSLMRTTTTDPDGLSTDIYTNKIGKVVLQRQRDASHTTDTWTVYDDKKRPVKIYPPGSSPATPGLIYELRYDGDNNVIYKKVPDAAAEEYRYSVRNLQTAKRNAVLQAAGRWLVTHYDAYGRPAQGGYHNGSDPGTSETPTIHTLLEEYFYDGYNGSITNTAPIYKGKLKKSRIKVLEDTGSNSNWVETEYSYDSYGRVSTEAITNHLGGTETKTYTYDFADHGTAETHFIAGTNGVYDLTNHTYDAQGRKVYDKLNINGIGDVTTAECRYDHKSQIIERNLGRHSTTGTNQYLQSLDYTYNPQGWLTGINALFEDYLPGFDPCDTGISSGTYGTNATSPDNDLFALNIRYNTTLANSGVPARLNGNITSLAWWHRGQYNQAYNFKYDHLNRVTEAKHGEIVAGNHYLLHQYNEKFLYDERGNFLTLDRKGMVQRPDIQDNCYKPVTIDSLTYVYQSGTNKLVQVIDNAPCMDTITLPAVIDRDINYAAGQLIRIATTDVLCDVNMNLTAGTEIKILDTMHLPNSCGTPALVIAYQGPCPQDKYTEGFNQQSISGQYTYDNGGNMNFDPNKKHTYYYNYHNLPYKIVGSENDELQMVYSADGTLLQRKYIKNNATISKRDYLRGKEYKDDMLESIYHNNGRVIQIGGNTYKYEYHIKDHLGNVRVTFVDDNNNGLITGTELRSRNDYYSFGMEWNNRWELSDTILPTNNYRYNNKEYVEEMGLNSLLYGARFYNPTLGIFHSVDAWADKYTSWSPYCYTMNNPIKFTDPTGNGVEGDIYNNKGVHIGNDGKDDQKVFLLNTTSETQLSQQQSLDMTTNLDNNCVGSSCVGGSDFSQVNITNDELNLRSALSTLKRAEAGSANPALQYNSWNQGVNFTNDSYESNPNAYASHPGKSNGSSAAGAYQSMAANYNATELSDFSPGNQDKFAVNLLKSSSYKAALSGNMSTFKTTTSGRWTSLKEWSSSGLQTVFNSYRANELQGRTNIATPVGSAVKLRGTLKI